MRFPRSRGAPRIIVPFLQDSGPIAMTHALSTPIVSINEPSHSCASLWGFSSCRHRQVTVLRGNLSRCLGSKCSNRCDAKIEGDARGFDPMLSGPPRCNETRLANQRRAQRDKFRKACRRMDFADSRLPPHQGQWESQVQPFDKRKKVVSFVWRRDVHVRSRGRDQSKSSLHATRILLDPRHCRWCLSKRDSLIIDR